MKLSMLIILLCACLSAMAHDLKTPNMSANALFLYRNSNFHKEDTDIANPDQNRNGLSVQEAELQFYSDIDPYARMNLSLSIHPDFESTGTAVEEKWTVEPEEGFVESNATSDVTLKIGKFKAAMGKHNTLHAHAYPFIEGPLGHVNLLGEEGLNDIGLSAAVLLPMHWFSEVCFQYLRGEGGNVEFNSPTPADGVGLVHWKNFFDLTEAFTMEIGASYASGANSSGGKTNLTDADLTFKWRPSEGGKYQSLIWVTEYLGRTQSKARFPDELGSGLASWIQYQFAERWSFLYRYDNLMMKKTFDSIYLPNGTSKRNSIGLNYMPSEFSSYKLEFDQRVGGAPSSNGESIENAAFLQANFTIGAHPAHSY